MSEPKRISMVWLMVLVLIAVLVVFKVSYGQEDHGHGQAHHGDSDAAIIDASSIVTGDSSWGIGAGGPGDVDISDCLGSTQWGFLTAFKQKLVRDETCIGFRFLVIGQYDLAAMHFCNDKNTLKEFADELECEAAHDFTPAGNPHDLGGLYDKAAQFDEHFELAQEQEQEIEYLQEEQASLVGRVDDLTAMLEQASQPAPAPVQKQAPQYSREQFNAVWTALGIKEAEDEDDE